MRPREAVRPGRERRGQDVDRLEVRGRAKWEALLAGVAFPRGDFGEERDLLPHAPIDESHRAGPLHFGAVANAQAAVDAEVGLLLVQAAWFPRTCSDSLFQRASGAATMVP